MTAADLRIARALDRWRGLIGQQAKVADGGTVTVTTAEFGVEHGEAVVYVTGVTSLGNTITRWMTA